MKTDLAVEIEQIKGKQVHFDFNVLGLDIFSLASTEILEGQEPLIVLVPRHGFTINDK